MQTQGQKLLKGFVDPSDHCELKAICNPSVYFQSQIEDEVAEKDENKAKPRSSFTELYTEQSLSQLSCYSIGMVMKHRRYNYHCVIFGWDPICKATSVSVID